MAVAFLPVLSDTQDYIKYSVTALDEGEWVMLMKRPILSATGTGLLAPFTLNVWILILVSLLIVGPLIYCIIILRYKITGDTEQRIYHLTHCMWFVYGALLKQGSTLSPIAGKFYKFMIFHLILVFFFIEISLKLVYEFDDFDLYRLNSSYIRDMVDFYNHFDFFLYR